MCLATCRQVSQVRYDPPGQNSDWNNIVFPYRFQGIFLALILLRIVLPLFDQGPLYEYYSGEKSKICIKNFWYTILHITNFIQDNPEDIVSLKKLRWSSWSEIFSVLVLTSHVDLLCGVSTISWSSSIHFLHEEGIPIGKSPFSTYNNLVVWIHPLCFLLWIPHTDSIRLSGERPVRYLSRN